MTLSTPSSARKDRIVSTGCAGLDDILGAGLTRNHLYLIEGDPGTGKTTLALQFLLAGVAAGEKGIYITLSESPKELTEVAESHNCLLRHVAISLPSRCRYVAPVATPNHSVFSSVNGAAIGGFAFAGP